MNQPTTPTPPCDQRILVIGTTGSGKTTMAHRLSRRLGLPHIELDALHWGPDWTPVPLPEFRASVQEALSRESWMTDGNYSKVRDITWGRADTIVWLDYPLPVILGRLLRRTLRRVCHREQLWSDNRESFQAQFLSRDSLFLWALQTYRRR
ncbi:MAG TPA: adenylate kinase, partial [Chloroflexi bacterium]|nr:adenylate kinase [Chloroflexota bacterium]